MIVPQKFLASKPKELCVYKGWSYEGKECPKHKAQFVKDDHECCGCCCSGCDPQWTCPKCEEIYDKAYNKWFRKFGHMVAVADGGMLVEKGKLIIPGYNLRYMQFLHGGKPLKIGSWCKLDKDGYLTRSTESAFPQMLIVS